VLKVSPFAGYTGDPTGPTSPNLGAPHGTTELGATAETRRFVSPPVALLTGHGFSSGPTLPVHRDTKGPLQRRGDVDISEAHLRSANDAPYWTIDHHTIPKIFFLFHGVRPTFCDCDGTPLKLLLFWQLKRLGNPGQQHHVAGVGSRSVGEVLQPEKTSFREFHNPYEHFLVLIIGLSRQPIGQEPERLGEFFTGEDDFASLSNPVGNLMTHLCDSSYSALIPASLAQQDKFAAAAYPDSQGDPNAGSGCHQAALRSYPYERPPVRKSASRGLL
jgi:hypothetical protein